MGMPLVNIFMNCHGMDPQECNAKVKEHVQVQHSELSPSSFPNSCSQLQDVCSPQSTTFRLPLGMISLFNFSHSGWCEVGSHWVLTGTFQMKLKNFHMPNGHVDIFFGGVSLWTLSVLCPEALGPYCVCAFLPQFLDTVASNGCT